MTVDEFLAIEPQFVNAGPTLISQALLEAATMVDLGAFGDPVTYGQAFRLKVCHLLALKMYAQQKELKGDETTPYEEAFKVLCRTKILAIIST